MLQDPYDDYEKERKAESAYLRRLTFGFAIFVGFILLLAAGIAMGEPMAVADERGIKITLYNDKCELPAVSNLPLSASWVEGGKSYKGCWAPNPDAGVIVAYFDDKTVALIPIQLFKRLQNS